MEGIFSPSKEIHRIGVRRMGDAIGRNWAKFEVTGLRTVAIANTTVYYSVFLLRELFQEQCPRTERREFAPQKVHCH